jgi:hypothetical protein
MPLRTLSPSPSVTRRLALRVGSVDTGLRTLESTIGGNRAASLGLAAPHPVFNLDLNAIDSSDWISHAKMTGWRYLVTSGENVIA